MAQDSPLPPPSCLEEPPSTGLCICFSLHLALLPCMTQASSFRGETEKAASLEEKLGVHIFKMHLQSKHTIRTCLSFKFAWDDFVGARDNMKQQTLPLSPQATAYMLFISFVGWFNTLYLIFKVNINPIKACSLDNNTVPMFIS